MERAAGMSLSSIAIDCAVSPETIKNILNRPEVMRKVLVLEAMIGRSTSESLQDLDQAIEHAAETAFDVEKEAMHKLNRIAHRNDGEDDVTAIKAYVAASVTAQDILDRAGKRAPTRVVSEKYHAPIPPAALENLGRVLEEMGSIEVTATEIK
jgi:hypothetical protein